MKFFKAVNKKDLNVSNYIPGTVTNDIEIAYLWYTRYSSTKKNIKGAAKHINRGESVIIQFEFDPSTLKDETFFQEGGVSEHNRQSCWTSKQKDKAQINIPIQYNIVDINTLCIIVGNVCGGI